VVFASQNMFLVLLLPFMPAIFGIFRALLTGGLRGLYEEVAGKPWIGID